MFLFSQALYDFVDDNPVVDMVDVAYTNNPYVIAKQHKMTAINSAIEVRYSTLCRILIFYMCFSPPARG